MLYYPKLMKTLKFEVRGGFANAASRDLMECFSFQVDEHTLKMLSNSHPHIEKIVRGALCKKFIEELSLFVGREMNMEEAHARCRRIG